MDGYFPYSSVFHLWFIACVDIQSWFRWLQWVTACQLAGSLEGTSYRFWIFIRHSEGTYPAPGELNGLLHFFLLYLVVHRARTTSEVLAKILGDGLRLAVELKPQQSRNPDMMQTSADLVTDPYSQESTYRGPAWRLICWSWWLPSSFSCCTLLGRSQPKQPCSRLGC